MTDAFRLGIDCGSVSLNLVLLGKGGGEPIPVYRRTSGRPLHTLLEGIEDLLRICGRDVPIESALVTGSGRELLASVLQIRAINEISAHSAGVLRIDPRVRTVIEIGGQDSKFIRIEPDPSGGTPRFPIFRMNDICAAGTGAFLDEQCARLGIPVESFGEIALKSEAPAPIAGRCAVFAKTDMIHKAQEGTPMPDILMGLALALARNYVATLIRGESIEPVVSLQGGVMSNAAVVHAFKRVLGLEDSQVVRPRHFTVLGALGCAYLSERWEDGAPRTLADLKELTLQALDKPVVRSCLEPLDPGRNIEVPVLKPEPVACKDSGPLVMGLDVGSVSVKGVIVDSSGKVLAEDYRLSRSRPLEALREVMDALCGNDLKPDVLSVTGSGRYLAGRLIQAELIVNEITAQARAALSVDPNVDTVVEIGGQDSKWIGLERGVLKDFEMNRVCAAGTGSFLMEQAARLDVDMGKEFSDRAFASHAPADLGNRCTVFMESDLVHHQNNGASSEDLAAGVCVSVAQNYLERVANNRPLGERIMFLGGVAALPAVRAAFERATSREFHTPRIFRVSGALGAALKAQDKMKSGEITPTVRTAIRFDPDSIDRKRFQCHGCSNNCLVDKYHTGGRVVFHGGLCDRWEVDDHTEGSPEEDVFGFRNRLLEECVRPGPGGGPIWGMVRTPHFYELFPFWSAFCEALGITLVPAAPPDRRQFERGTRFLLVETCLPMKVLAGQIADLTDRGINTIFHPGLLTEESPESGSDGNRTRWPQAGSFVTHCPYIQASSQFFKGSFDVEWIEPTMSYELDPGSFRREHLRLARRLGFSRSEALEAYERGIHSQRRFTERLRKRGEDFLRSLGNDDRALVVLGKPYHTSERFLNMNLASLFRRLGVHAVPGDLFPLGSMRQPPEISWKHQGHMIRVAREIARDPRFHPVLITFFGCGPDPFTLRHLKSHLEGKPLLVLEMDEHSSRAGLMTRIEAFLDRLREGVAASSEGEPVSSTLSNRKGRRPAQTLYMADMADHTYGFAAAARSCGVEAHVLPPSDEESERLGRPHMVGGECHPYALVLGDYLKLAHRLPQQKAERSFFYMIGADACRLQQYPIYIDKVRRELGHSIGVIGDVDQGLAAFGLSPKHRGRVLLRAWEGLNAFDLLRALYVEMRPAAVDRNELEAAYLRARDHLFQSLSCGRVRQGMEEALHELAKTPVDEHDGMPLVAVAGDYYSRVVPFANNHVFDEIERLGGRLLYPPCFSDSFKLGATREVVWRMLGGRLRQAASDGLFSLLLLVSEFRVRGGPMARSVGEAPLDPFGIRLWRSAAQVTNPVLPAGINAPLATTLRQVDEGADGVLNLITLNCLYGTVVTAALTRALRERPGIPMLTLVFDGLKKTNERTRVEAFMEQVHDNFRRRRTGGRKRAMD